MTFRFLSSAKSELKQAARFYEDKVPNLGFEFLGEIRSTIRRILAHPQAWHSLDEDFRRCRTARFPYGIIYTVVEETVLIIAVMHLHRRPESWRENLESFE